MRELEINQFLKGNKWVSGAVISKSDVANNASQVYMDISPDGHDLIRDQGMQAFEQKILARLFELGIKKDCWKLRSVREDIWEQLEPGLNHEIPRVLSLLDAFLHQRMLLDVSPDLGCFKGHFPGNPILAGVVQLHWAVCFSQALFRFDEVPVEIKRLKFKSIVSPPRILELVLNKSSEQEVQFEFASLGQVHSQGRLIFDEEIPC